MELYHQAKEGIELKMLFIYSSLEKNRKFSTVASIEKPHYLIYNQQNNLSNTATPLRIERLCHVGSVRHHCR